MTESKTGSRPGLEVSPDWPSPQELHRRIVPGQLVPPPTDEGGGEPLELTIDDDYVAHVGGHEIVLGGNEIFLLNSLLLQKDRPLTADDIKRLGFVTHSTPTPQTVNNRTLRNHLESAYKFLAEQLNSNGSTPLVATQEAPDGGQLYYVNPNLKVTDKREQSSATGQTASHLPSRAALGLVINESTRLETRKPPQGELYARIVTPDRLPPSSSTPADPINVEVVDNITLRIGDKEVRLGPHERYLFNALMLHRDQAIAARELRSHGFRPGASETSANASFYKTTQDLMARLNEAAGTEVVTKLGQKRASRYAVNPNLALSDLRTEEDLAREVIDPRYRGGGKINPDFTRSSERISAGNLYARLIDLDRIPEVPLREGLTPVEIAIVDNTTLRIGDENVRLGAHERYLFNALMLLRDKQNAARNLRVFGFHPEAEYATATVVFSKTANSLLEQLNNAAGIEIIRRLGQRRSTCYVVNPRLLLTDLRTDEDRAAEIFDLPSSGRRASGSRSEGEFHELTSEGDLYERIIDAERIPTLDIRDGTPIELLVDDNNTLRFGGETIQLGAHARYIFNALMLLREAPASGGELRQFGFFPGAKQGTALMAFSKEMTSLIEQLNEAVGVEIFKKVGERRNMRYAVNPNLVLIDNRTDEDKARQVTDQPKRRGRRPSHERFAAQGKSTYKGPAFEGSEEEVERYDDTDRRTLLITELAQRYSNHPLVLEAIGKLNNGAPITVGLDQPYFRYLAEISQYDLLDAADEVRLFKILEKGINAYKDQGITPKNEHALIDSVIARQIVYVSNLRLVIDHAKQWGFYSRRGMGLLDFVQEGNIGLADAIDRFDYRLGFKFSTYATWWIRQGIQRSDADKSRLIRIPVHMHDKLIQFSRTVRELTSELDRDPNPWEIAYKFGEPVSEVLKLQHYTQLEPASLNALLEDADKRRSGGGISNTEGIDQIADPANPMEEAEQEADDAAFIEHIFSSERLTLKEKYVLSFRLGFEVESLKDTVLDFGDGTVLPYEDILEQMSDTEAKGYTLEEGGQLFGVTRERIRQIEKKALEKVRTRYQREQRNA